MANAQTSVSSPVQRMEIVGNIVEPDPDDHRFNLYEDLRTRLHGTVTVLGEIVKSDPELWSDDR